GVEYSGRARPRLVRFGGAVDADLIAVELQQQIVGELDVGLVDFIDQQHRPGIGHEGVPQLAALDVVADIVHAHIAELAVAQPRDRVVFIKSLQRLRGRFDVHSINGALTPLAISSASTVLPVPGSPLTSSGRSSVMAALTATLRSSVAT